MKIFDYEKRKAFETFVIPDGNFLPYTCISFLISCVLDYVPHVTTIAPIPGSRKKFLRVGRGISAGQGKTCGRGMRGQKSRSGEGGGVRPGFEGGQTALYRRLPKFVGKPMKGHTKTRYELIKLEMLNEVAEGSIVSPAMLREAGILTKSSRKQKVFKVVGNGELTVKGLTVRAHAFTESARAAIEANGGTCVLWSPTRDMPLEEALAIRAAIDAENLVKLKELRALKVKTAAAKEVASV